MKTIIAGSRSMRRYAEVEAAVRDCPWLITHVICGTARGPDLLGARLAKNFGLPVSYFPADWNNLGRRAGYVRNREMAQNVEALLAVWDGQSKGTKHMIDTATRMGLKVHIHRVASPEVDEYEVL